MSKEKPQVAVFGAYEIKERWAEGWGRCIDTTHIADDGERTIIQSTVGLSDWIFEHVWKEKVSQATTWSKGAGVKHVGGRKITGQDMVNQAKQRQREARAMNERARNWARDKAAQEKKTTPKKPDDKRQVGTGTESDPLVLTKGERGPVMFKFKGGETGQVTLRVYKNKPSYDPKTVKLPKGAELTVGSWRSNPRWIEMKLKDETKKVYWRV